MAIGNLSKSIDKGLAPVGKSLAKAGITPNCLTFNGLILASFGGLFLYHGEIVLGIIIILAAGLLDLLDGLIARHSRSVTVFGGFLDSLADRYADFVIFGSLIMGGHIEEFAYMPGTFWGLVAIVGALLTSYTRALSESKGVSMKGVGLIERPERILIFALFGLLGYLTIGMVLLAVLGNFTVMQRAYHFYKANKRKW